MESGDGRYKYTEKTPRMDRGWWIVNRYVCLACAIPQFGAPPPVLIRTEKDVLKFGVVNRYLRPITPE
jgi:hypothetical protein